MCRRPLLSQGEAMMGHIGKWEAGTRVIYLTLGRVILLFQTVTHKGADKGEGTLDLHLNISISLLSFFFLPCFPTAGDNHPIKCSIFEKVRFLCLSQRLLIFFAIGSRLDKMDSHISFWLVSTVDSQSSFNLWKQGN